MMRQPAVAGRFYPKSAEALRDDVRCHVEEDCAKTPALGVICPHAGFMYSGDVAGSVYSRIEIPERVVLLGPNHTGRGHPVSIMMQGKWAMPFGAVSVDAELASAIREESPRTIVDDARAHASEHSLETQLPFLQYFRADFKIVPLCLMGVSYETCKEVGAALWRAVSRLKSRTLVVASSDMTHYESHTSASRKDRRVIDAILSRDAQAVYELVHGEGITMCGINPATVLLHYASLMGATQCELVRYMTSGEVSGDMSAVVGYAGIIVR